MNGSRSIAVVVAGLIPGLAFGWLVSGRPEKASSRASVSLASAHAEADAVALPSAEKSPAENSGPESGETPALAPHKPVAVGTPEFDAAVHEALKLDDYLDREVRIREILSDASLEQFPAIYEAAKRLPPSDDEALIYAIGQRWAEVDPRGAVQFGLDRQKVDGRTSFLWSAESRWATLSPTDAAAWAQTLPPGGIRNDVMNAVINVMTRTDPQMAVQLLRQHGSQNARWVARSLFGNWADRDPKHAAAAALELNGELGKSAVESVAKSWAQADPSSAIGWAASIPSAAMRKNLVRTIAEQWAQSDPVAELAWARNQTDPQMRRKAIAKGLGSLAVTNLPAAFEQINGMPSGKDRNEAVQAAAYAVSASDARSGLRLAELLPAGLERNGAVSGICNIWGQKEPRAALDWLLSNTPSSLGGGGGLQEIVRGWAGSAPDQAIAWAQALPPGDNQNSATAALIGGLAASDVTRAESIFQQIPPEAQKLAVPVITRNLMQQGADKARAWAESLPAGPAQSDAFGFVAAGWSDQNPTAAAQWLGALPEGKARDAAIAGFVGPAFDRDPEGAAVWVQTISDPRDRDRQTEELMRRWLGTDSNAARAWLDANPQITPEEKGRILED